MSELLPEIILAVQAIRALAKSIHARVPGESQSEDDSREIVSIADRIIAIATPPGAGGLREKRLEAAIRAHMEKSHRMSGRVVIEHDGTEHAEGDPCDLCAALARKEGEG